MHKKLVTGDGALIDAEERSNSAGEEGQDAVVFLGKFGLLGFVFLKVVFPVVLHVLGGFETHDLYVFAHGAHEGALQFDGVSFFLEVDVGGLVVGGDVEAKVVVEFGVDDLFGLHEFER